MRRTISTSDLRKSAGKYVDAVKLRGDRYIIEQRGKECAALVPLEILQGIEVSRQRVAEIMKNVAEGSDLDEDEAMEVALSEVDAARAARRSKSFEAPPDKYAANMED